MNADLAPALVAAGGGMTALLAGVWAHERRADEAMRASRLRLSVRFPTGLDPLRAFAALDCFSGLPVGTELASASQRRRRRRDSLPVGARKCPVFGGKRCCAESFLASVSARRLLSESPRASLSLRVFVPTPSVLHAEGAAAASHTLLARLTTLGPAERVVVRWHPVCWRSSSRGAA